MGKNILMLLTVVSELNNRAIEKFFETYGSEDHILICTNKSFKKGKCRFEPKVHPGNIYLNEDFRTCLFDGNELPSHYQPADEELLAGLNPYEGEIYRQMSRIFPPVRSFDDRQRRYYNAVRLFNGMLEEHKIGALILDDVPHRVYDFVLYALCKAKNIPVRMLYPGPVTGYIYFLEDIRDHGTYFKKYEGCTYDMLPPDFQKTYDSFQNYTDNRHLYNIAGRKYGKLEYFFERLKALTGYPPGSLPVMARNEARGMIIKKYISKIAKNPDMHVKYIYFPLHVQPEATTSPMAGKYCSQQLAVEILSYLIPENWVIYVKEHPDQGPRGEKNIQFFKEISRLKNVQVVPTDYSSIELMKHAAAIAACTGTIAFESMFLHKPAVLFGKSIYNYRPGAFFIDSVNSGRACIEEIEKGVVITEQDIFSYLYSLSRMCYKALPANSSAENVKKAGITFKSNNYHYLRALKDIAKTLQLAETQ